MFIICAIFNAFTAFMLLFLNSRPIIKEQNLLTVLDREPMLKAVMDKREKTNKRPKQEYNDLYKEIDNKDASFRIDLNSFVETNQKNLYMDSELQVRDSLNLDDVEKLRVFK